MLRANRLGAVLAFAVMAIIMLNSSLIAEGPSKIDSITPIDELKSLSAQGNADAMLELGERMIQGQGIDTNMVEGRQWIQKAADAGNSQAWYDLGMIYSNGMGVELNMPESMNYFRKGADLGNSDCQTSLGLFYQAGDKIPGGVKADPAEAAKWYRLAADQNHQEAIYHLAQLYLWGQGVAVDSIEAAKWFRKGAEAGNPDSQWMLGICYRKGVGLEKNNIQAYALISAAVDGAENPEQKQGMAAALEKISMDMTPEQIAQAKDMSKDWIARQAK
jgi:uncharacterized protein